MLTIVAALLLQGTMSGQKLAVLDAIRSYGFECVEWVLPDEQHRSNGPLLFFRPGLEPKDTPIVLSRIAAALPAATKTDETAWLRTVCFEDQLLRVTVHVDPKTGTIIEAIVRSW